MKRPIEFVALESASLSKEGIFDFLFGKKDEPASYKKLERLEAELAQVKAKEILDVVAGRTKPTQDVIDRIVGFAEKHIAPAMVYRQNTQLFDILAKLVHLPDPQPYRVSEELDEAQTAKDAERIAKDFIRVMGPQLKLMRGAKQVVIGTATPEQLLADVTSNYQENMKHIKNCSYSTPTPHETYLATCLAQDFGYPSGTWSNCGSPGLEELRDKNESLFDEIAEALENIADVADEFEMCWKLKKESKYRHYNPINDDLSFLVRARCALLDYALKLKVSKEDLEMKSSYLSNEGIFDFLFGKKKEDETPSMKRLEKLEAEAKQLKAGPALDILQGRAKPGQELLDKLLTIAEKHLAPSQVYKQNSQLFDILCKLVALPAPNPYAVSSDLEKAQTASEAKKVLLDYIKLMEPQVKLCRSTTKKLVTGPAKAEALFDDVTKHYADNWAFIKRYCYANARDHRTYEAATFAQDFGYPCGIMGNRDTPGVEALYEENPKQFKVWGDTLEDIADAAGEFEMLWSNGKSGKDWSNFNPAHDDVEFLIHARCALLSYVLDLKVSQEGKELVEAIDVATEAYHDLEVLVSAMESAKIDPNFGKYNLPLYRSSLEGIYGRLGLSVKRISTESFDDSQVLSVEGLGKVLQSIGKTIKDLIAKFVAWLKGALPQKVDKIEKETKANEKAVTKAMETQDKKEHRPDLHMEVMAGRICGAANKNEFSSLSEFIATGKKEAKRIGGILSETLQLVERATNSLSANGGDKNIAILKELEKKIGDGGILDKERKNALVGQKAAHIKLDGNLDNIRALNKTIFPEMENDLRTSQKLIPTLEKLEARMIEIVGSGSSGVNYPAISSVRAAIMVAHWVLDSHVGLVHEMNRSISEAIKVAAYREKATGGAKHNFGYGSADHQQAHQQANDLHNQAVAQHQATHLQHVHQYNNGF